MTTLRPGQRCRLAGVARAPVATVGLRPLTPVPSPFIAAAALACALPPAVVWLVSRRASRANRLFQG